MSTLSETLSSWRTTNQAGATGYAGLLSKLKIGDSLYAIKDPAVEALATEIETRLQTIEGKTQTPVTKENGSGKFATIVEQGATGVISVTYSDIRSTALEDTAVDGQFITTVSQGTDGQISIARAGVTAGQVTFDKTGTGYATATTVYGALDEVMEAAMALKGATTDASSAETIAGAKAYADAAVQSLAGTDWTEQSKKVQDIIAELEGSTAGAGWSTMVDKLAGMTYIQDNAGVTSVVTASSVSEYVEARIAAVNAANAEGIDGLDATVGSTTVDTGKHVAVQVVEEDGMLTSITVTENDIASATALATLDAAVVKTVNGVTATNNAVTITGGDINLSSATAVKLDTYVTGLDSTKANKAAITTGTVNNWTTSYVNETLTWTNTETSVYEPVSGQTL